MGKNTNDLETFDTTSTTAASGEAAPATAAESKAGIGRINLTNGESRISFIKRRFLEGATRSEITKEVNSLMPAGSKPVPYQVIFSATKGLTAPAKPAVEAAPSTEPAATV